MQQKQSKPDPDAIRLAAYGSPVRLKDAPPGLIAFGDSLCVLRYDVLPHRAGALVHAHTGRRVADTDEAAREHAERFVQPLVWLSSPERRPGTPAGHGSRPPTQVRTPGGTVATLLNLASDPADPGCWATLADGRTFRLYPSGDVRHAGDGFDAGDLVPSRWVPDADTLAMLDVAIELSGHFGDFNPDAGHPMPGVRLLVAPSSLGTDSGAWVEVDGELAGALLRDGTLCPRYELHEASRAHLVPSDNDALLERHVDDLLAYVRIVRRCRRDGSDLGDAVAAAASEVTGEGEATPPEGFKACEPRRIPYTVETFPKGLWLLRGPRWPEGVTATVLWVGREGLLTYMQLDGVRVEWSWQDLADAGATISRDGEHWQPAYLTEE